nr:MAG TPA: hypothetical protein [Caudoviricetes sp.]
MVTFALCGSSSTAWGIFISFVLHFSFYFCSCRLIQL